MNHFDKDIDDLLNLTDTDSSSSSNQGIFDQGNHQFVMELHDIERDQPTIEPAVTKEAVIPETRTKKKKKRRIPQVADNTSDSSTSSDLSGIIPKTTDAVGNDEFYDADESYHDLTEDNIQVEDNALLVAALAQVNSEHGERLELNSDETNQSRHTSASLREPSNAITKPAVQP